MTVRGVFSSCEASATNCRCWSHALATGRTSQRASSRLMTKNTARAAALAMASVRMRLCSVVVSAEVSAKTTRQLVRVTTR